MIWALLEPCHPGLSLCLQGKGKGKKRKLEKQDSEDSGFNPRHLRAFAQKRPFKSSSGSASSASTEDPMLRARAIKKKVEEAVNTWASMEEREVPPLLFWQEAVKQGEAHPSLVRLAKQVFAIPGSNALLERTFSHTGRAVHAKRARLSPGRACATIFLHENYARGLLW